MDADPQHPDIAQSIPRDVWHQLIHTLREALQPVSDSPEDLARRDNAAIALVASLLPANADEATLAVTYVAAQARALDCLRLAREHSATDVKFALRCTAQAASMMRQARATRALLLRAQAERRSLETVAPAPTTTPDPPPADIAAQADRYALTHRKRAALIRSLGRLPDKLNCGPLPRALITAIVTGSSPVLRSLDKQPDQPDRIAA